MAFPADTQDQIDELRREIEQLRQDLESLRRRYLDHVRNHGA